MTPLFSMIIKLVYPPLSFTTWCYTMSYCAIDDTWCYTSHIMQSNTNLLWWSTVQDCMDGWQKVMLPIWFQDHLWELNKIAVLYSFFLLIDVHVTTTHQEGGGDSTDYVILILLQLIDVGFIKFLEILLWCQLSWCAWVQACQCAMQLSIQDLTMVAFFNAIVQNKLRLEISSTSANISSPSESTLLWVWLVEQSLMASGRLLLPPLLRRGYSCSECMQYTVYIQGTTHEKTLYLWCPNF